MCNSSHIAIFCPRRADFEKGTLPWTRFASARGDRMLDAPLSTRDSDLAMPANLVVCQLHLPLLFVLSVPLVREVLFRDVERAVLSLNVAAREILANHAKHSELKAAEQQD